MNSRAPRLALLLVAVLLALTGCGGGAPSSLPSVPHRVADLDEAGPPASTAAQVGGPPASTLASSAGPLTTVQSSTVGPRASRSEALTAQFSSDRWVMAGLGKGAAGWAEFFAVDLTSSSRNPDGSPSCLVASNDAWARIPSSAYQSAPSAPTYTSSGDIDGDGRDELVIGTGDAGRGTVYVYRPTSSGFVYLASVSLTDFAAYTESAQAPSYPACVDIDGDGRAELVVGTGPGGHGFAQIFRYDAATRSFSPLSGTPYAHGYVRVGWTGYTDSGNAPVFPAGGWLRGRGTGKTQQLVLGLGSSGQGWVQLWTWNGSALVPWTAGGTSWLQVVWPTYNASGDAPTYPAVGDVDGDGYDDLVLGLGDRGAGWLEVFRSSGAALAPHKWVQVEWSSYTTSGRAPTHPAVGDIDGDGKADLVVGLGDVGQGWMWVVRGTAKSWSQVQWGAYAASAIAPTWPCIGRGAIPSVTALQITPTISSMPLGTHQSFVATATLSDGSTLDASQSVTWSSSNAPVLSMAAGGGATAVASGAATVSATLGTKTASLALTVTPAAPVSLEVSPNPTSIFTGSTHAFTAMGIYTDGSRVDVTAQAAWASDSLAVAFSGAAGVASGISAGSATVSASLNGVRGVASCTVVDPHLVSIAVSGDSTTLPLGVRQSMHATGAFEDGSYRDVTALVTWSSSDATRVTVSASGEATAVAVGTAAVRATFGVVVGSLDVSATAAALASIQVSPLAPTLAKGLTQQLTATGVYTDGTQAELTDQVTWQSSDAAVTVSNANGSRGLATAASKGSATVTATLGGKSGQATVTVTDAAMQSLEVSPTTADVPLGLTQALVATAVYTDGSRLTVTTDATWSSADPTTVAVSNSVGSQGVVTSLKTGTVTITASLGGKQATASVTASAAVLQQVQVTPPSASLPKGLEQQFQATGVYSDASTHDLTDSVTWSTSDGAVASISNASGTAGLLRALATGGVTVTATLGGKSGTVPLTVTPALVSSVVVSPATVSLPQGVDRQMTATANLSDGTTSDVTGQATWTTDDEAVAVCSTTDPTRGQLHAVAAGATSVKATLSGKTGSATVTVTTPALQRIDVAAPGTTLPKGVQSQCTATGVYDNGTHADLTSQATWTSTDTGVATVSIDGLVTGVSVGTATIQASFGGMDGTLGFTGTAAGLASIQVSPLAPSLAMGLTQQMTATGVYTDGTQADLTDLVTWQSSDAAVMVSNANGSRGLATAAAQGSATVTATLSGKSGQATFTATEAELRSVTVTPAEQTVPCTATAQYVATGTYSDGSTHDLTLLVDWLSSDTAVATISNTAGEQGKATVTGTSGTTTIRATANGLTGTATLTAGPEPGTTWTVQQTSAGLWGVISGASPVLVVGASGTIRSSTDGATWTGRVSGAISNLYGGAYGNSTYVAVGYGGKIQTSSDGVAWVSRMSGTPLHLFAAAYGNGTFVAVGWPNSGNAPIVTSPDGVTWTARTSGTSQNLTSIAYGNGRFVATGTSGTVVTSSDAVTWTTRTSGTTQPLAAVTFANETFVAVGQGGTILTSTDGATWTAHTSNTADYLTGCAYGNGTFVALGNTGALLTSTDGTSWTVRPSLTSGLYSVGYGAGNFIAAGKLGTILTSPDGVTWTSRTTAGATDQHLYGIAYGNGQYVAVGGTYYGPTACVLVSSDGLSWTRTFWALGSDPLRDVALDNGTWIASSTTPATYLSSIDGSTWTTPATPPTDPFVLINRREYGNGIWVAPGPYAEVQTSTDGQVFTRRPAGSTQMVHDVAFGNGVFVAVGDLGTILTSRDGITWTPQSSGTAEDFLGATFGNNRFVVVGSYGTVLTSP